MVDTARSELSERLTNSVGLQSFGKLERVLLTGEVESEQVIKDYPEFNISDLSLQLAMFRRQYEMSKVDDAVKLLRTMSADMRNMFSEVEKLIRLLLVIPCSSADAERSFSALRRLKTWLRSTMTQHRLNSVAVCHCHQDLLDNVDINEIMQQFVSSNESRVKVFGTW